MSSAFGTPAAMAGSACAGVSAGFSQVQPCEQARLPAARVQCLSGGSADRRTAAQTVR
jgi:hypothetical protein